MKTSDNLTLRGLYSRKRLQELFNIADSTINTGVFRPAGHDSIWLFVTEEKTSDRTQYKDRLDGDDLYFEGQTEGRTDSMIVGHGEQGQELLVFHRLRKDEHPDYAFRYEGIFEFVGAASSRPTAFHLRRSDAAFEELKDSKEPQYWAFACNPDYYDGLTACSALDEIAWKADRLDPRVNDLAIIWQGKGSNEDRGVVGLGQIIEGPGILSESVEEQAFYKKDLPGLMRRVRMRLIEAPGLPLWQSQHPDLLSGLKVARARGGTVFTLQESQWQEIFRLSRAVVNDPEQGVETGQGWIADPRRRKAVERHAQDAAAKYFADLGYEVLDVSASRPYDLLCSNQEGELHVEVKGCTGPGDFVFLTRNEVLHAKAQPAITVLVIVNSIEIVVDGDEVSAIGGTPLVIRPWAICEEDLTPLQFQYRVPL